MRAFKPVFALVLLLTFAPWDGNPARGAAPTPDAVAELPTAEELPQVIQDAKQGFTPPDQAKLKAAEEQVRAGFQRLDQYLAPSREAAGWKKHLKLEGVDTRQPAGIEAGRLEEVRRKLYGRHGRILPPSGPLHTALSHYLRLRRASEAQQAEYEAALDRLAASVDAYGKAAATDARTVQSLQVGDELAWLEGRGQAPQLVGAVRRHWSRPNLFGHASDRFLSRGMARSVDETSPIHENILGTSVHGTGRTVGATSVVLVPSNNRATFDLMSYGTTYSDTVGYNSGASIFSHGVSRFAGRKRMYITAEGTTSLCAAVNVCTHSDPYCLNSGRGHGGFITRIADRVAWKRVYEAKPSAEQESSRLASAKIQGRIDQEAAKRAAESSANFDKKYRLALLDADAFPSLFRYSTTDKYLQMTQLQARADELGAPDSPPPFGPQGDFAVQMHESMLENYFRARFGGQVTKEKDIRSEMMNFMTEEEYEDRFNPNGALIIVLDKDEPVTVRFRKDETGTDGYTVKVLGVFTTPNATTKAEVRVAYKFVRNANGRIVARRIGGEDDPPDVKPFKSIDVRMLPPPNNKRLETAQRGVLVARFDSVFPEEQKFDPLVFSGELSRVGELPLTDYRCDQGWMVLTWKLPEVQGPPAARP